MHVHTSAPEHSISACVWMANETRNKTWTDLFSVFNVGGPAGIDKLAYGSCLLGYTPTFLLNLR
jgi:hypothetical protein